MFDRVFLGYDTYEVDDKISSMGQKIEGQQKDIDYLRNENEKLKKQIKKYKRKNRLASETIREI